MSAPEEEILLATVFVAGAAPPSAAALHASLVEWGEADARVGVNEQGLDVVLAGGGFAALEVEPGAALSDTHALAGTLLNWPEQDDVLGRVRGRVLVAGGHFAGDDVARRVAFTRVVAAIVGATPGALAVQWTEAPNLVHADELVAQARAARRHDPPTPAWIGLVGARTPDGTPAMATRGLAAFGHTELLLAVGAENGSQTAGLAWGLAAHVIVSGASLDAQVWDGTPPFTTTRVPHPHGEGEIVYVTAR